jgi:hypothetical protein
LRQYGEGKMTRAAVAIFLIFLGACSPRQRWHDTSGQGRGYEEMHLDSIDCYAQVDDAQALTGKKLTSEEIFKRLDPCMEARQWAVNE